MDDRVMYGIGGAIAGLAIGVIGTKFGPKVGNKLKAKKAKKQDKQAKTKNDENVVEVEVEVEKA